MIIYNYKPNTPLPLTLSQPQRHHLISLFFSLHSPLPTLYGTRHMFLTSKLIHSLVSTVVGPTQKQFPLSHSLSDSVADLKLILFIYINPNQLLCFFHWRDLLQALFFPSISSLSSQASFIFSIKILNFVSFN